MQSETTQTVTLTEGVKQRAIDAGFVSVGITSPEMLRNLPYGWVGEVRELYRPEEELPNVKSVIVMAFNTWDTVYSLKIDSPSCRNNEAHSTTFRFAYNSFGYEVMKNKAWTVIDYLRNEGFESKWSVGIPLKTAAIKCGLGCQGKSSLLLTPDYGPRVFLIAVLTSAEMEIDQPFEDDLCGDCERCIKACPTKAIEPYRLNIEHCMVYPLECPDSTAVPDYVREKEQQLIKRPTPNSYIQCTRCIDVCPIGRPKK